jgi:hypothetical protein
MNKDDEYYDRLDEYYSDPKTPVHGIGKPLLGKEAAAAGQAFLVKEFGSAEEVENFIRRGRPRLGQTEAMGPSREIRGRVTDHQYLALQALMQTQHRTMSELIRDMADSYLKAQNSTP